MSDTNSSWKSPSIVIAAVGLAASIAGNIYQYSSSNEKLELEKIRWEQESRLAEEIHDFEEKKFEYENEKLIEQIITLKGLNNNRDELKAELVKVNKDIVDWEGFLFQDNLELTQMKNKLNHLSEGPMKEAHIQNIRLQEEMMSMKKIELDFSKKRKEKIEAIINT